MAGRHREQILLPYRDDDGGGGSALARRSGRRRLKAVVALVVVALAVPATVLVVGGAVLQRSDEPAAGEAQGALPTAVALAPRRVPPRIYPTSGEFVPPVAVTPTANPAAPTIRRTTRPSDSPRERRCPSAWMDVPPLVDWCKRHGYSTD